MKAKSNKFQVGDIVVCNQPEYPRAGDGHPGSYQPGHLYEVTKVYGKRIDTKCLLTGYENGWNEQFFEKDIDHTINKLIKEVLDDPS